MMSASLPTTASGTPVSALLFDMDGTLIDSEGHWRIADQRVAEEHGSGWDDAHDVDLEGVSLTAESTFLRNHCGVQLDDAQIQRLLIDHVTNLLSDGFDWIPGAYDLLIETAEAGLSCALVTSAPRSIAEMICDDVPAGTFDSVIAGDDVPSGKPDPDAYLMAASRLGFEPRSCLAVEDSTSGAQSAYAAGCHLVIVDPDQTASGGAGNTVTALAGQSLAGLIAIARTADT